MTEDIQLEKFFLTITEVEKKREFDRKVDRLKKSSSATTVWAVIPGLFGFFGIGQFYLNRPLEGLIFLLGGFIPSFVLIGSFLNFLPFGYVLYDAILDHNDAMSLTIIAVMMQITFFVINIISARYHYSRYDFYIHWKAKKPWNDWGLNSQI